MTRAVILVLDSLGVGASADADQYGDSKACTLGHIAQACQAGVADTEVRTGPLSIPNLLALGLGEALKNSWPQSDTGLQDVQQPKAAYGYALEHSFDKDTPSGHWEMTGVPVPFKWATFPKTTPCFPQNLINELVERCELPGVLGQCHASGTTIIQDLGEESIKTGKPIVYTSADSVFQIAAHETHFGLDKLLSVCQIAKELTAPMNITRVIARPFDGDHARNFQRTHNRKDLTTAPIENTLLDAMKAANHQVVSVGKINDIFAGRGITKSIKAGGNMALFDAMLDEIKTAQDNTLIFVNFVDFDSLYGHRRDVAGYAQALEDFDTRLPELFKLMTDEDVALITADHGCDPTQPGSDHTREHVPVVFFGPNIKAQNIGQRDGFMDMGQTLAHHFKIKPLKHGQCIPLYE
ncbi:phosphopentomutase [Marinicella rhabdoformis]|uniref:phosphopentomutase n=1 Tax=Marinicella rhabdoformis TaxID=2580566 RepID=UPI0012AEC05B|nr:phosphopentomutase [Marinicella rhabdoformis]